MDDAITAIAISALMVTALVDEVALSLRRSDLIAGWCSNRAVHAAHSGKRPMPGSRALT